MKLDPNGLLNVDIKNAKRLGFDKLNVIQLQLISTTILVKLVISTKVTITCLGIQVIQKHEVVVYIDLKSPKFQTKIVSQSKFLGIHPINVYKHQFA
jgi:hypothetical protein